MSARVRMMWRGSFMSGGLKKIAGGRRDVAGFGGCGLRQFGGVQDARLGDVGVLVGEFAADEAESFEDGGLAGGARAGERVEHHAARRRHQTAQVAHEVGRLHRLRGVRVRDTHPILLSEMLLQLRRQLVELLLR